MYIGVTYNLVTAGMLPYSRLAIVIESQKATRAKNGHIYICYYYYNNRWQCLVLERYDRAQNHLCSCQDMACVQQSHLQ